MRTRMCCAADKLFLPTKAVFVGQIGVGMRWWDIYVVPGDLVQLCQTSETPIFLSATAGPFSEMIKLDSA